MVNCKNICTLGILAVIMLVAPRPNFATLFESFGTDPYSQGMAGAGSSASGNWGTAFRNPAGLALPARRSKVIASTKSVKRKGISRVEKDRIKAIEAELEGIVHPFSDADLTRRGQLKNELAQLKKEMALKANQRAQKKGASALPVQRRGYPRHNFGMAYIQHYSQMDIKFSNSSNSRAKRFAREATSLASQGFLAVGFAIDLRTLVMTPFDIPIRLGGSFGLSADGTVSNQPAYHARRYNFRGLGANANIISAAVSIGLQLWKDRLSIGGGPGGSLGIKGNAEVSNLTLNKEDPPDIQAKVNAKSIPAPLAGIIYRQPMPFGHDIFLGFAYRSAIKAEVELEAFVSAPLGIEAEVPLLSDLTTSPTVMIGSLSYDAGALLMAVDIELQKWSEVEKDVADLTRDSFNHSDIIVLRSGFDLGLYNIFNARGSFSFLHSMNIRSGYAFVPAYTPDQNSHANYLDNDKHIISFGLAKYFSPSSLFKKAVSLDWSFQWQIWSQRRSQKESGSLFYDDSEQPDYVYGGNVFITGLSLTFTL